MTQLRCGRHVRGLVLLAATGCTGNITTDGDRPDEPRQEEPGEDDGREPPATPRPADCDTPARYPAPLAQLSEIEYNNSLRSLLGTTLPWQALPAQTRINGFDNNAEYQSASLSLITRYRESSAAAVAAVSDPVSLAPCARPDDAATAKACGGAFVKRFGRGAFRRPLDEGETSRFSAFFAAQLTADGYESAVRATLQAFLQSPQFLYRVELGEPVDGDDRVLRLTAHELAARLSYLLIDDLPDTDLAAAADDGSLLDPEVLEQHAHRLLNSGPARAAVARFHDSWLGLATISDLDKDTARFPWFDEQVTASLREGATRFVDSVFWEGTGTLSDLLTAEHAFVDRLTARIYAADAPSGDAFARVPLPGDRRAGILMQAGWLAAKAHFDSDSPVHRGIFVLENLLCTPPPPPPADVDTNIETPAGAPPRTTRQKLEQQHHLGSCGACHRLFDGIGFAFGNFDAVGAHRDSENGVKVDTTGVLEGTLDVDGPFTNAIDLVHRLARSTQVSHCAVTQWFRYGLGRSERDEDVCTLDALQRSFANSGGNFQELLLSLVESDAFRFRDALTDSL